jgi:hypothetical protein
MKPGWSCQLLMKEKTGPPASATDSSTRSMYVPMESFE